MRLPRLTFLLVLVIPALLGAAKPVEDRGTVTGPPVRIGLTPALLHYQHSLNAQWKAYLQERLRRPVVFVQRDSYRETMDMLIQNRVDFAWICSYPYVTLKDKVNLLVVPMYQGHTTYRSYLIVPDTDTETRSIADLKDKVFAYADPLSNTGYLAPRFAIKKLGENPDSFFKKTFFTWAHRNVVESVADRLAQGGAVDSYIWNSLVLINPKLVQRTRVVTQSAEFGFPPFVAHLAVSKKDFTALQTVLMNMKSDPEGQEILKRLNLDGFIIGGPRMYDSVAEMARSFGDL